MYEPRPTSRARYLALGALVGVGVYVAVDVLLFFGFRPHSFGGRYERVFIGAELAWIALTMAQLFRAGSRAQVGVAPVTPPGDLLAAVPTWRRGLR